MKTDAYKELSQEMRNALVHLDKKKATTPAASGFTRRTFKSLVSRGLAYTDEAEEGLKNNQYFAITTDGENVAKRIMAVEGVK